MAAIVLDDEDPHQKEGIDNGESDRKPDGNIPPHVHHDPDCEERKEGIEDLNGSLSAVWKLISLYNGGELFVKFVVCCLHC